MAAEATPVGRRLQGVDRGPLIATATSAPVRDAGPGTPRSARAGDRPRVANERTRSGPGRRPYFLTVKALVTVWPAQLTLTGTRPGMSLRGILIWIQPCDMACENGFFAIVNVSLHARRGVVKIVTVPPGAIRAGETES